MSGGRRHHRQSKSRDAASLVFGFFLSLAFVGVAFVGIACFCAVSVQGMIDDDYYELVQSHIEDEATYYTLPTGIDPAVLDGVFTTQGIRTDVDAFLEANMGGTPWELGEREDGWQVRLRANVLDVLEATGSMLSADEREQAASAYVADIQEIYAEAVAVPGLDSYALLRGRAQTYLLVAGGALGGMCIVLTGMILRLHHYVHRGLRYLAYAVGGAALMCAVAPMVLLVTKPYAGMGVRPQYLYHLATSLIERALMCCATIAIVYLLSCMVLCMVSKMERKKALDHLFKHV